MLQQAEKTWSQFFLVLMTPPSNITWFTTFREIFLPSLDNEFNTCVDDEAMKIFCSSYCLNSLIKQPTCFKNPENPGCIDLILTNKARSFQSTCLIETGLSDFHRMTISVLKMPLCKLPPKVISYRDFKIFENERFITSLQSTLESQISIALKILTYSLRSVRKYLIIMLLQKKSTYVEIINLL